MGTSTRRRVHTTYKYGGVFTSLVNPPLGTGIPSVSTGYFTRDASQVTISTGTLYPVMRRAIALYPNQRAYRNINTGSQFYTSKVWVENFPEPWNLRRKPTSSSLETYVATVLPVALGSLVAVLPPMTGAETLALYAKGTTAISRCIPTNPVSGLANFLGELKRDGLPLVPGAHTASMIGQGNALKKGSAEYLNYEFAIKPTLSDIRKFGYAVKNQNKILKQYLRDSGKNIRRRYSFPTERTVVQGTTQTGVLPSGGPFPVQWVQTGGTLKSETETTVDRWFSGAFVYHLEFGDRILQQARLHEQLANKLVGSRLTPEVAWNLTPWSWAADWVTNAGDIFHNVSAFQADGLVMRYGYMMETKTIRTTYRLTGLTWKSGVTGTYQPVQEMTVVQQRKVRIPASPFGFGLTDADFTLRQKAIIAALGITQGGRLAK